MSTVGHTMLLGGTKIAEEDTGVDCGVSASAAMRKRIARSSGKPQCACTGHGVWNFCPWCGVLFNAHQLCEGCNKPFKLKARGRVARFCSVRCQKRIQQRRLRGSTKVGTSNQVSVAEHADRFGALARS